MLESMIKEKWQNKEIVINETEHLLLEAKLAASFIERWGMVVGTEDGEDSDSLAFLAGRSKFRLATPEEIVEKATTTAKLFMKKARELGWVHITPSLNDMREDEESIEEKDSATSCE